MATYNSFNEQAAVIKSRLDELLRHNKPLLQEVYNDMSVKSERIFEQGRNSNGGLIGGGTYSTTPMYMNPNFAPRKGAIKTPGGGRLQGLLPTKGKPTNDAPGGERFFTEKTAWHGVKGTKAGDPHRTTYLAGGYKELRNRTGRRIDRINLRFTNDLFLDWANTSGVGGKPKPTRVNPHQYQIKLKRDHNVKKLKGLESRFGKIFTSTRGERNNFLRALQNRVNDFLNGIETD